MKGFSLHICTWTRDVLAVVCVPTKDKGALTAAHARGHSARLRVRPRRQSHVHRDASETVRSKRTFQDDGRIACRTWALDRIPDIRVRAI